MKTLRPLLSLVAITCLGLSSCFKQVPIDEDMNQRKAAISVATKYMQAFEDHEVDKLLAMSKTPYWLDGKVVGEDEELNRIFREELIGEVDEERWELLNARFYSTADMEMFAPRLMKKLKVYPGAKESYFVALQMTDKERPSSEPEGVIFLMAFEDGQWYVQGLDD